MGAKNEIFKEQHIIAATTFYLLTLKSVITPQGFSEFKKFLQRRKEN